MAGNTALMARLAWLIGLRWIAAACVIVCAAIAAEYLGYPIALVPLQVLGAVVALYNLGFRWWLRRLRTNQGPQWLRSADLHANAQISADLVALALVVHFTGGMESPLSLFFVFHTIIASMILSRKAAVAQATLVVGLYTAVLVAEALGWVPHYPLGLGLEPTAYRSLAQWPILGVFVATMYVATYLTSSITGELRRRERELELVGQELSQQAQACDLAYSDLQAVQRHQVDYMRRIAHELKSPLAAISMMLQAAREVPADDHTRLAEMTDRAAARATAALQLVEDLLTLSEIREAAPREELADLSVGHLIENVVAEEEVMAAERGVPIITDVEDGLPPVQGYRSELIALLRNLLSNAIKYSQGRGEVVIRARRQAEGILVEVADSGIGIPKDEIGRVFDEFYRTSNVRRAGIGGTGLGLAIVKSIAERHGGHVSVESEEGQGATFQVWLPLQVPAPREATGGPQERSVSATPASVD